MTHPLRTTLAAISLVCCGIAAAACVVSYVRPVRAEFNHVWFAIPHGEFRDASQTTVGVNGGTVYLYRMNITTARPGPRLADRHFRYFGVAGNRLRTRLLPSYQRVVSQGAVIGKYWVTMGSKTEWQWTFPLPLLVLLFALLPIRWAILRRRERRRNAAKVCVRCGYDLRACAERCSECGEPIARLEPV